MGKAYTDEKHIFMVGHALMTPIKDSGYRTARFVNGKIRQGIKFIDELPIRKTEEKAQSDLDKYAKKHNFKVFYKGDFID